MQPRWASRFEVADIYDTDVCHLARVMRRELKKRGVKKLKVVFSREQPIEPRKMAEEVAIADGKSPDEPSNRRSTPGSTAFAPAAAGLIIAGEIVKDLTEGIR